MSAREATAQQIDPLGAATQRPIGIVLAVFALGVAVGRTVLQTDARVDVHVAILALVFLATAVGILIVSTSPLRAPLRRSRFVAIVTLGLLAMITAALASAGDDSMIRDDWGPTAVGLLLLACSPFRPGRDLVVGTVAGSAITAIVIAFEAPHFSVQAPLLVFLAVGVTPLLALGIGSAVYSRSFVAQVDEWTARATTLNDESATSLRPGIARSVRQDRVTGLNQDVVPFFAGLVDRGELTAADSRQAGEVAMLIRSQLVEEADRTWLEQVVLDVCPDGHAGTVVDRSHLAVHMSGDQRTAVRALLKAMAVDETVRVPSLGIVLHDDAPRVRALLRIESASADGAIRQRFAPYFAVLRILFADLQVDVTGSFLTLRFSYDQH